MKNLNNKSKVLLLLLAVAILVGIFFMFVPRPCGIQDEDCGDIYTEGTE